MNHTLKTNLLLILLFLAMISCSPKGKNKASSDRGTQTSEQDSAVHSSEVPDSIPVNGQIGQQTNQSGTKDPLLLQGRATYRLKYCGGAKPTPEIEAQYRIEYALSQQKIKFIKGSEEILTNTNAEGDFSVTLSPGEWEFYLVKTTGSSIPPNPSCNEYFTRSYGKVQVGDYNPDKLKLLFAFPCDPCDPYSNKRP